MSTLTIAIPTHQPDDRLITVLQKVVTSVVEHRLADQISLLISFNGKNEYYETKVSALAATSQVSIRTQTHHKNLGYDANYLSLFSNNSIYTWPIGDDDLIRSESLPIIMECLKSQGNLDFLHVGGTKPGLNDSFGVARSFADFVHSTSFTSGAMASTITRNALVRSWQSIPQKGYYKNWVHLAILLAHRQHATYFMLRDRAFCEIDGEKRWITSIGRREINSDLWRVTDIGSANSVDHEIQRAIDHYIFNGLVMRITKDILRGRRSFDLLYLSKRLSGWR